MSQRNTAARIMHDVGLAAWFGGSLMGAVGVNGAANDVSDASERTRVASSGWARWTPFNAAAIGAHLLGGAVLTVSNRGRVKYQQGAGANTAIKTLVTGAALGVTAYSRVLGNKVSEAGFVPAEGGVKPTAATPTDVTKAQQQLRALQWAIPGLTGTLVALGAQQGEQQRPSQLVKGVALKAADRARSAVRPAA